MHARNSVLLPDPRFILLTILVAGCRGDPDPLAPVALPATAAVGASPAATGHIAFVSNRDGGNFEIYSMNPDGSNQTNLTNDPGADFQPAWSTDGSKIAFSRFEDDGTQHIWVMNADGSGQHQVGTANGGEPGFSPDGTRIVFTSFTTAFTDFQIHVMNADGTGDVAITSGPGGGSLPAWSPDGAWIVFGSNSEKVQGGLRHTSLYLVRPDGTDLNRLTTMSGVEFIGRWSPDGNRILFTHNAQEIWVVNRDGTGLQRIDHAQSYQNLGGFSPDGLYIVFDSGHRAAKKPALVYVMNADGSNAVQLTNGLAYDGNSAWGR